VFTYINSGNVLFDSSLDASSIQSACMSLIESGFGLKIAVGIISAAELRDAITHSPDWWNSDPESKHNAIFVIPPMTAWEICVRIGEVKPEYEKIAYHGKVIFWSAPIAAFSRTRLTKIVHNKTINDGITVRNANTALKLTALAKGAE